MGPCGEDGFQVLEFFAGVARVASLGKAVGYKSVAFDRDFGPAAVPPGKRRPMDLNGSAGLLFLGTFAVCFSTLRLAISLILRSEFGRALGMFAVCCSSWVPVNRGTGGRTLLTPHGNALVPSVRRSNKLMSRIAACVFFTSMLRRRSVLLQVLLLAAGSTVCMENPQNSLIALHDKWVWLVTALQRFSIGASWLKSFLAKLPCRYTR